MARSNEPRRGPTGLTGVKQRVVTGPKRDTSPMNSCLYSAASIGILVISLAACSSGSPPHSWASFCAEAAHIQSENEHPSGGSPVNTGIETQYDALVGAAPTTAVRQSLNDARDVLTHPVRASVAPVQRAAVLALNADLGNHCASSTTQVFKIAVS
jgi:hypothetical protein